MALLVQPVVGLLRGVGVGGNGVLVGVRVEARCWVLRERAVVCSCGGASGGWCAPVGVRGRAGGASGGVVIPGGVVVLVGVGGVSGPWCPSLVLLVFLCGGSVGWWWTWVSSH